MKKILDKLMEGIVSIFEKFLDFFKDDVPPSKSRGEETKEIIDLYNRIKEAVPSYDEPNYDLARKVFHEFNDFHLKNVSEINLIYLGYIPRSLLPYPKNYIKCAYYIYLEQLKKEKNLKGFNLIQHVGSWLFSASDYPDYVHYKENLKKKKWMDDVLKDLNLREQFKRLYGVYEVSKEDYYSSTSALDCTEEKLIHDFGFLPEIEKDFVQKESLKEQNSNNKTLTSTSLEEEQKQYLRDVMGLSEQEIKDLDKEK